jgi:hypothetical protein
MATQLHMDASEMAIWPSRCVRCNAHEPRDWYRLRLKRRTWYGTSRGPDVIVDVPACRMCVGTLKSAKFWRLFFIFFPCAVMGLLGIYLAQTNVLQGRFWDRWALKIFGIGGALPGIIFQICVPMPIDVELEKGRSPGGGKAVDRVRYEFASDEYAAEFMELNPGKGLESPGVGEGASAVRGGSEIDPERGRRNDRA